ncbi:MAG: glutamate 5-kinase [Patescibacteria group bacterium]|jgi:glutamate 5-kinase
MEKIVVKIGSQLIANGDGDLNREVIASLVGDAAGVIKAGKRIIMVSSGAVASGRTAKELTGEFRVKEGGQSKRLIREQMLAAVGQPELMAVYKAEFKKHGLNCAQILVTRSDFSDRQKYLSLRTVTENLVSLGVIPIFNENDVLSPEELDFSDNDQLSAMIAAMLVVDRLIILTNVAGVYDKDPKEKDARLLGELEDIEKMIKSMGAGKSAVGRGGMKSKLITAAQITSLGIGMDIASGFEPTILSKMILRNEKIGTHFKAIKKKIKPLKGWLSLAAHPKGRIITSCYLSEILKKRQLASVLLSGIEGAEGDFKKGDVVAVCDVDGTILAKGQCRYGREELLEEIRKYKDSHNEGERTEGGKKIAVHYDYLVFEK